MNENRYTESEEHILEIVEKSKRLYPDLEDRNDFFRGVAMDCLMLLHSEFAARMLAAGMSPKEIKQYITVSYLNTKTLIFSEYACLFAEYFEIVYGISPQKLLEELSLTPGSLVINEGLTEEFRTFSEVARIAVLEEAISKKVKITETDTYQKEYSQMYANAAEPQDESNLLAVKGGDISDETENTGTEEADNGDGIKRNSYYDDKNKGVDGWSVLRILLFLGFTVLSIILTGVLKGLFMGK